MSEQLQPGMKPHNTYICSECDELTLSSRQCPACMSTALIGVWRFIPTAEREAGNVQVKTFSLPHLVRVRNSRTNNVFRSPA